MHDLRHTCVTWLVSGGVSLIEVRDLARTQFGHDDRALCPSRTGKSVKSSEGAGGYGPFWAH